jgi:hypothetical protein
MKARSGGAASLATLAVLAVLSSAEARAADEGAVSPPSPAIPSTAAAEAAQPAESASDSFASEDTSEAEGQHRLDLYGFADVTYLRLLVPQSSVWNRFYFPTNSFAVGNFNLYLSSNLGDSWRALGEVRFMYLPNGSTTDNTKTGDINRTDTTVLDYAGFEEPIHWGAIRIERVWVEHEFSTLFKLQVGQFLTPYGIWNVDHGTPAIIGIRAPVAIGDELFPAHQTGVQLYGKLPSDADYPLTFSE